MTASYQTGTGARPARRPQATELAAELTSEVEVRFVAEGPDRIRVELEHRHLDRHDPGWQSVSDGVDSDQGWPLYLARYAALIEGR